MNPSPICWVITEGAAGMVSQAAGLAEATGYDFIIKSAKLKGVWKHAPPLWVPSPFKRLSADSDALEPPWPDIVIACGRKSIPLACALRKKGVFCVYIHNPRLPPKHFDLVVPSQHDGMQEGDNVIASALSLHRIKSQSKAQPLTEKWRSIVNAMARPLLLILLGGKSRSCRLPRTKAEELCQRVHQLAQQGYGVCALASRRTPDFLIRALDSLPDIHCWKGGNDNPYPAIAFLADGVVVTSDSVSMISEACSLGKPVWILDLPLKKQKTEKFPRNAETKKSRPKPACRSGKPEFRMGKSL